MLNRLSGSFLDQGPLNLRKTSQQSNDQSCHLSQRLSVYESIQHLQMNTSLLQVVQAVADFNLTPAKAIHLATQSKSPLRRTER